MVKPAEVKKKARKLREQNYEFRTFLKNYADPDELDAQFSALHNEIFADYDCLLCANCCTEYEIIVDADEIAEISAYLRLPQSDFFEDYITDSSSGAAALNKPFMFIDDPCPFLCDNGRCKINECKPEVCKKYPFTDMPDRLSSMIITIENSEVCPVVFEIIERLKKMYYFTPRRRFGRWL